MKSLSITLFAAGAVWLMLRVTPEDQTRALAALALFFAIDAGWRVQRIERGRP